MDEHPNYRTLPPEFWKVAQNMRQRSSMPPWEEGKWFQLPTLRNVTNGIGKNICPVDTMRVLIVAGLQTGAGPFTLSWDSGMAAAVTIFNYAPFVMHVSTWGPMIQLPWYATVAVGDSVGVWTLSLRDWPKGE